MPRSDNSPFFVHIQHAAEWPGADTHDVARVIGALGDSMPAVIVAFMEARTTARYARRDVTVSSAPAKMYGAVHILISVHAPGEWFATRKYGDHLRSALAHAIGETIGALAQHAHGIVWPRIQIYVATELSNGLVIEPDDGPILRSPSVPVLGGYQ
jgi:hypothetical protein